MELKNKLYRVTLDGEFCYDVAAKGIEEAISMMGYWRPNRHITGIKESIVPVITSDDIIKNN